jgi:hypothetical protein
LRESFAHVNANADAGADHVRDIQSPLEDPKMPGAMNVTILIGGEIGRC